MASIVVPRITFVFFPSHYCRAYNLFDGVTNAWAYGFVDGKGRVDVYTSSDLKYK